MADKTECDKKCLELIRSDNNAAKDKGLRKLTACFQPRANTYLINKGIHNDIDRQDLFNQFLEKIVRYTPLGRCSYGIFFNALHDSYVNFFVKQKRTNDTIDYIDQLTDHRAENVPDTSGDLDYSNDLEAYNCVFATFHYMRKHHPKDFEFLMSDINRTKSLKDFAASLFIGYGAARQRRSKVNKLFYQIKRKICDE